MYISVIKPLLDFIISLAIILILSPVIILVGLLVYFKLGTPVLFCQTRPGKDEKLFKLYKFRTMNYLRNPDGVLLPDKERITDFGMFLRRTSMDELPQFFNVLKGNLSLVGPRPLLVEYLNLYDAEQKKRHNVKPGITGWAQVNGRNIISFQDKFKLDVWYIDNLSFSLDLKILFLTIINVFLRKGISKKGHTTTDAFNGKN
jgi:lipopolysaccharide/colanic/teichoic acid biosynthesis glycosyltransferase